MTTQQVHGENSHGEADVQTVESFLRCTYLAELMGYCIVDDKYKPPVPLVAAITLSARGKTLAGQAKGDGVGLHEAQLAAFLVGMAGDDLLFEPGETSLASLAENVSIEVRRRKMKFPWIFGRDLYDLVANSTFHGDPDPSLKETLKLLESLPQGVFQAGPYTVGPYGVVESKQWRAINPSRAVPGYHCDQVDCDRIHGIHLSTGECGVSKARTVIERKIAAQHGRDTTFIDQAADFEAEKLSPYAWTRSTGVAPFLFECLTRPERCLLMAAVFNSNGSLRAECEMIGLSVKDADDFAAGLGDAEYLQILLLASDADIHSSLNRLIWDKVISIPDGETRACRILGGGFGPLAVRLEASSLGVRYRPAVSLLQVRLRKVFNACFPPGDTEQQRHLHWLLREQEGDTAGARLSNAMSADRPAELASRILVSSEGSYRRALDELALPSQPFATMSDAEIAKLITWHIGFVGPDQNTEMSELLENLAVLKNVIRGIPVGNLGRAEASQVRQLSSDVFVGLEQLLKTALAFITWSMINDHYAEARDLSYTPATASGFLSNWLSDRRTDLASKEIGKFALGDLLECFGLVGAYFGDLEKTRDSLRRKTEDLPRSTRVSGNPFTFPFKHLFPYLDLDSASRWHIRSLVRSVPSSFGAAGVLEVRNGLLHHTTELPDRNKIGDALDVIEARVSELANNGLYPLVYAMVSSQSDSYGRRTVTLRSAEGQEILLVRPTALDLSGFPELSRHQSVVVAGRLADFGEPLRFSWNVDSPYRALWNNFPKRPPVRGSLHRATNEPI